jgi:P2 family phage contractile tail tube protein
MPKILKNFQLFVDGRGYAGRAEEVTPPKLTIKTEELRAGGMDAPAEIDMGMEKIEAGFTLVEYDPELLKQFGVISGKAVQLTLRGALVDDTTATPMVIRVQGMFKEIDFGKFKAGDKGTMQCSVACRYYSLEIDNKKLVEIDIDNMTRVIDGNDQMADIRNAIGL